MSSDKLSPEHTALLDRARKLGISTYSYVAPIARVDKLRQLVEDAERGLDGCGEDPDYSNEQADAEPAGTLDDALGVVSQLEAELDAIPAGGLATPFARNLLRDAVSKVCEVKRLLEAAMAEDDREHPEDNDMPEHQQSRAEYVPPDPTDRNTPIYVIIEFTKPVSEGLLRTLVDHCGDAYGDELAPPRLANTVKQAHRATFDGFGHHVTVEPVLGNDPSYTE